MKKAWIIGLCTLLVLTGCSRQPEKKPEPVVEEVVVEEVPEVEEVEDLNDEAYRKVRLHIQEQLLVFDASRFDEGLMIAVRDDVKSGMDNSLAKEVVLEVLDGYLDMWKREIVTESLEFLVGEYSRADYEKLMQDTSNDPIQGMVAAYVIEKLKQEGYEFD